MLHARTIIAILTTEATYYLRYHTCASGKRKNVEEHDFRSCVLFWRHVAVTCIITILCLWNTCAKYLCFWISVSEQSFGHLKVKLWDVRRDTQPYPIRIHTCAAAPVVKRDSMEGYGGAELKLHNSGTLIWEDKRIRCRFSRMLVGSRVGLGPGVNSFSYPHQELNSSIPARSRSFTYSYPSWSSTDIQRPEFTCDAVSCVLAPGVVAPAKWATSLL